MQSPQRTWPKPLQPVHLGGAIFQRSDFTQQCPSSLPFSKSNSTSSSLTPVAHSARRCLNGLADEASTLPGHTCRKGSEKTGKDYEGCHLTRSFLSWWLLNVGSPHLAAWAAGCPLSPTRAAGASTSFYPRSSAEEKRLNQRAMAEVGRPVRKQTRIHILLHVRGFRGAKADGDARSGGKRGKHAETGRNYAGYC